MSRALDQSKFGPSLGRRDEVAGVRVRDLDVLSPVTDHEPSRRHSRDRDQGIDSQDVVAQLLGRQQILLVTHHACNLHRPSKLVGAAAPRFKMRRRRERGDATNALIVGGDSECQRASESEAGQGDSSFPLVDAVEDLAKVLHPLRRGEGSRAPAHSREGAGRDHPARLRGKVFGQFGEKTGGLTAHAHRPGKAVHDDEGVTRDRTRTRCGDAKVEERVAALQLLVGEHAALNAQALSQKFAVVGGVTEEQFGTLRSLEVEVGVMLPREANATVDLNVLCGAVKVGLGAE
jgi:hypothetical protein